MGLNAEDKQQYRDEHLRGLWWVYYWPPLFTLK
jgi:hypothetical protein